MRYEYPELSSSKYMQPVVKQDRRRLRRARDAKAIRNFGIFLIGLAGIRIGVLAAEQIDVWRPYVEQVLSATGLS